MSWFSPMFNHINLNLDGKSLTTRKMADIKNYVEFIDTFASNVLKALARYDIEGLPETCDIRVVKESLLFHGSVCFFEKEGNILALPCAPDSDLTLNGDIKTGYVYGRNGYNQKVGLYIKGADEAPILEKTYSLSKSNPKGVFVRENEMRYPFVNYALSYAMRMSDTMRALDVVRENIKQPFVVVCEESLINTVKKYFEDKKANVDKIVSSGIFPADKISITEIPVLPESIKTCTDLIEWYTNRYDQLCGFYNNANPDKKERLLVDEVNANNDSTDKLMQHTIDYLQSELDFVNKIFGLSLEVKKGESEDENIQPVDNNTRSGSLES